MDAEERFKQLGTFLRECRERIGPAEVGLPKTSRRRTPGLRREEVAQLAGISTTYYTKIEQGSVEVSEHVLCDLVNAMHCNHTEIVYAHALASGISPDNRPPEPEQISPGLQAMLDKQNPYPAQIIGRRWDFLAWNEASSAVMIDMDELPDELRNLVMLMFTVPEMRLAIENWETHAKQIVAEFRADYGKYHNDPNFAPLIASLKERSPEFDLWWEQMPGVGAVAEIEKIIHHPTAGILHMLEMVYTVNDYPSLRLIVFLPRDSETEHKVQQLYDERMASKAAGNGRVVTRPKVEAVAAD